jgi:hypothetical protein
LVYKCFVLRKPKELNTKLQKERMRYELNFEAEPFEAYSATEYAPLHGSLNLTSEWDELAEGLSDLEEEEEFRLYTLPSQVRDAFNMGPLAWPLAVRRAIDAGIVNLSDLTNMVFFMHHPERISGGKGTALNPREPQFEKLRKEWVAWRTLIEPLLKHPPKPTPQPKPWFTTGTPIWIKLPEWYPEEARKWAALRSDKVEVKRFKGHDRYYGDVIVWKKGNKVDGYQEAPVDLRYYLEHTNNERVAKLIQAIYRQWNTDMSYYVEHKKINPEAANIRLRREGAEILKLTVKLVTLLGGGPKLSNPKQALDLIQPIGKFLQWVVKRSGKP